MKHIAISLLVLAACGDDGPGDIPEQELITRVTLTFASQSGPDVVRAAFDDPDGDGGEAPTVDPIQLVAGTTYDLSISFQNALEDPPEEITTEVRDEGDEHQVFFTGTAVKGPATTNATAPLEHAYADMDANGLPLGLANTMVATAGSGELVVTLLHVPPVNEVAVKSAQTTMQVRDGGFTSVNGDIDVAVTFAVTVP
jgi:predicted small lipoprotein YifL